MIVDTSALLAILFQEQDAEYFAAAIASAGSRRMSAASFLEAAINVDSAGDAGASAFLRRARIEIVPVTFEQAQIARQAYLDFGKGRHPAGLNFGDCFAYALVRESGEPLLFKGNDFDKTDIPLYQAES